MPTSAHYNPAPGVPPYRPSPPPRILRTLPTAPGRDGKAHQYKVQNQSISPQPTNVRNALHSPPSTQAAPVVQRNLQVTNRPVNRPQVPANRPPVVPRPNPANQQRPVPPLPGNRSTPPNRALPAAPRPGPLPTRPAPSPNGQGLQASRTVPGRPVTPSIMPRSAPATPPRVFHAAPGPIRGPSAPSPAKAPTSAPPSKPAPATPPRSHIFQRADKGVMNKSTVIQRGSGEFVKILMSKYSENNVHFTPKSVDKTGSKRDGFLLDFLNPTLEFYMQMGRAKAALEKMLTLPESERKAALEKFNKETQNTITEQDLKDALRIVNQVQSAVGKINQDMFLIIKKHNPQGAPYHFSDALAAELIEKFSSHLDQLFVPIYDTLRVTNFAAIQHFFKSDGVDKDLIQITSAPMRYITVIPEIAKSVDEKSAGPIHACLTKLKDKCAYANVVRAENQYQMNLEKLIQEKKIKSDCIPSVRWLLSNYRSSKINSNSAIESSNESTNIFAKKLLKRLIKNGTSHIIYDGTDNFKWNIVNLHSFYTGISKKGLSTRHLKELDRKLQKHAAKAINAIEKHYGKQVGADGVVKFKIEITGEDKLMYEALLKIKGKSIK